MTKSLTPDRHKARNTAFNSGEFKESIFLSPILKTMTFFFGLEISKFIRNENLLKNAQ
jgi:hypothetical protein